QAERAHLQSFIDRFSASAAKAKQAQSRVKRLAKMANTEAVRAEREVRIDFPAPLKLPHALMRLNHADCGYAAVQPSVSKAGRPALESSPPRGGQPALEPSPSRGGQGGDGFRRGDEHLAHSGETQPLPSPPLEGEGAKGTTILHDVGFGLEAG